MLGAKVCCLWTTVGLTIFQDYTSHDALLASSDWPSTVANGEGSKLGTKLGGEQDESHALFTADRRKGGAGEIC